jgi:DNA-binding NtrC family response regulator
VSRTAAPVMIGEHPAMHRLRAEIEQAALLDAPVLIEGRAGSGKEVAVELLHQRSGCRGQLVAVNVAALPDHLIESELFGSQRGAFTGAHADRPGLIEGAAGGTLFLDEAAELPLPLQVKLLRVLEGGAVRRVGATRDTRVRFRLVLSSQEPPASLVETGKWRDDFYYRVVGIHVRVPTLSEHLSDVPLLLNHFLAQLGRPPLRPHEDLTAVLLAYPWPGNVREVRRAVEQAAFRAGNGAVTGALLMDALSARLPAAPAIERRRPGRRLRDVEREHIELVLRDTGYDTTAAADILGLSVRALYRRFHALGIVPPRKRDRAG